MKSYSSNLLGNVVSVYDKTKTTIAGRVFQKTINTTPVLGPPLTKFIDVFTDTLGTTTPGQIFASPNGRVYVLSSTFTGTSVTNQLLLYSFDYALGIATYVGRINFSIAAPAAATIRGIKIDDSNTSNIRAFFGFVDTQAVTGGLMVIHKLTLADFVPVGFPTIYTALASDVKGVYSFQMPNEFGGGNLLTTCSGISLPFTSSDATINKKVFVHNGVSATHQMYVFDYTAAPTMQASQTTTAATVNGTATYTMTAHGYNANDALVITASAPTPFVLTSTTSVQTVYYVRATNLTANTFELSSTPGGAAINNTSVTSSTVFVRGLGMTSNNFVAKTANLPALAGTLLLTNSENYAVPSHTANTGMDCVFFCTSTTMYLGKYTDLFSQQTGTTNATINVTGLTSTAGLSIGQTVFGTGIPAGTTIATIVSATAITLSVAATTSTTQTLTFGAILWANLVNANVLGSGTDFLTPVPVNAVYSSECDATIFSVSGIYSFIKKFVNSQILGTVGAASNIYLESQMHVTDQFSLQTIAALEQRNGWLFASCISAPQRGLVAMDLRSDDLFSYSYVVTPIMPALGSTLKLINTIESLFDYTSSLKFQYRTAATAADSIFNSATTNWTDLPTSSDLTTITNSGYVQFRFLFAMTTPPNISYPSITTPAQVNDLLLITQPNTEISDYWDYSYDASSVLIPTRVGFILRQVYNVSVPTLYYRAYDTSDAQLVNHNTITNAANFEYSTNNGTSWLPLGTIPNTVGTLLRYTYTTPPGVDIRVSIRES